MKPLFVVKKSFFVLTALSLCFFGKSLAEDICSRFGEDALRNICGLDNEVTIQIEASDSSSNPYCLYKWPAETKRKMKVGRTETEIEVDQENKVMIIYPNIGSTSALDAFERSIKVYPDPQKVDGVGEAAVWSEKRKQLTAAIGGRLYHVQVNHHDSEEDKSFAQQILEAITS
jgi:hypothetical protein